MTLRHIQTVTRNIEARSQATRAAYLEKIGLMAASSDGERAQIGCSNLAHAAAGAEKQDRSALRTESRPHFAIISAYNDMLSAHHPLKDYPDLIKEEARSLGATAQFAGGVPAMCDGVTQGRPGMRLSLLSRDVIAMATAVALSHNIFDGALYLGVCDKIVPGLVMGALAFGHIPAVFIPAGPMPSGLSNVKKSQVRQAHAAGQVSREALLEAECASYHGSGTCTFYGTANSNQILMEFMGLHLPGSSFVNPGTPLREALTRACCRHLFQVSLKASKPKPIGVMLDARSFVNAMVGLLATGGSTNHSMHLVAMAACAGLRINWQDFADLSDKTPLLCRIYPNGAADVNHFHQAGGTGFLMRTLLEAGHLHPEAATVWGTGLGSYAQEPFLDEEQKLAWRPPRESSGDVKTLRPVSTPFQATGGLKLIRGPLGEGILKLSSLDPAHWRVRAPAMLFRSETEVQEAFKKGALHKDVFLVLVYQGPRACGMPELHALTAPLQLLQGLGFQVALVTDGRMSGASGKVPAVLHQTPEAARGGRLAFLRDGDILSLDAEQGRLEVELTPEQLAARTALEPPPPLRGFGLDLFETLLKNAAAASEGGGLALLPAADTENKAAENKARVTQKI